MLTAMLLLSTACSSFQAGPGLLTALARHRNAAGQQVGILPARLRWTNAHHTRFWGVAEVSDNLETRQASLATDRRRLLERFRIVDVALEVVGVGSVGTRCYIVLLEGHDHGEPLLLQVKEWFGMAYKPVVPIIAGTACASAPTKKC